MASNNTNEGVDMKEVAAVGAGIAAIAAGAYFFFGPDGKRHQKKMRGWMVRMKGEVLERLEEARDVSEPVYNDIVDTVAKANAVAGKIPKAEILALAADLKRQWRTISKSSRGPSAKKASPRGKTSSTGRNKKTKSSKK